MLYGVIVYFEKGSQKGEVLNTVISANAPRDAAAKVGAYPSEPSESYHLDIVDFQHLLENRFGGFAVIRDT